VPLARRGFLALAFAPALLLAVLFAGVVHSRPTPLWRTAIPTEALRTDRCTWYCHNHGCPHAPVLPAWLASDRGAFGVALRGLYGFGDALSSDRATGYGLANLLVFCVAWPALTGGLWIVAIVQHAELKQLRRRS